MPITAKLESAQELASTIGRGRSEAKKKSSSRQTEKSQNAPKPTAAGTLRARLGLTQSQFAPVLPVSVRSLATLERGAEPTEAVARRLTELSRLVTALSEVMKKESIGRWLRTSNPAFAGSTPAEVVERGEADRLWAMVYFLRSGDAF